MAGPSLALTKLLPVVSVSGNGKLTAAFVYPWDRWLDGPDLNDPDTPEENPGACNFGYLTGQDAFQKAQAAGINTQVAWWLDVESDPSWSGDPASNQSMIQGVIDALQYGEGINSVGIYASPAVWSGIVGNWSPSLPYWAADWGLDPSATCTNIHSHYGILPSGPLQVVQYSSPSAPTPFGGMDTNFDDDYAC